AETVSGTGSSGRVKSNGDYDQKDSAELSVEFVEWGQYVGHKGDALQFNMYAYPDSAPTVEGTVRVCATWPAFFTDEGVDGLSPAETYQGESLSVGRVKVYPASFAQYQLIVVGAWTVLHQVGTLDAD